MSEMPRILTVLIEYSPSTTRVIVRGVWLKGRGPSDTAPLEPGNRQNFVDVFEGIDMKVRGTGFTGLVAT